MPLALPPNPPAIHARVPQRPPPLEFIGYAPGMPVATVEHMIVNSGGRLTCKATRDPRMRDCTGSLPFRGMASPFNVLVSSVKDSAAVIVLSTRGERQLTVDWIPGLTSEFGKPNDEITRGVQESWQWIRTGTMMRVVERKVGNSMETSVTLTHGPLLDGLGAQHTRKPD